MPNVTAGGSAGGNDGARTHVLPNDTAAEDAELYSLSDAGKLG